MNARNDDICDVPGILVGHDTLLEAGTGCTLILGERPMRGGVDVRGGAPGTRETDLLDPRCMVDEVHAILLTGGSAYGLDAAGGVMRGLEERGVGFDTGMARVPIVPAAVLFDLGVGSATVRPDAASGMRTLAAARGGPVAQGSVGAGTGATVGKMAGPAFAMKGGIGSASAALPDGHVVGALVAVNAVGDIYDANGAIVAGARSPSGAGWLANDLAAASAPSASPLGPQAGVNTTLAIVATDVPLSKAELAKLAQMAWNGLAIAIRPVSSPFDGDTVFALSTDASTSTPAGQIALGMAGAFAAQTLARAVVKAARAATSLYGVPAAGEAR